KLERALAPARFGATTFIEVVAADARVAFGAGVFSHRRAPCVVHAQDHSSPIENRDLRRKRSEEGGVSDDIGPTTGVLLGTVCDGDSFAGGLSQWSRRHDWYFPTSGH